jgi:SAM-dependent methyltransferase
VNGEAMNIEGRARAVMAAADRRIAAGDTMYEGHDDHYFGVGQGALSAVLRALDTVGMERPRRILDFGCGHGRVMRGFRAAFPEAEILASDLDASAVAHCAAAFGALPVRTSTNIDHLEEVQDVDLVWCGSVLTHLDAPQWPRLLAYFARALSPAGVAVVTVSGRGVALRLAQVTSYGLTPKARAKLLEAYQSSGFGYQDYPGQSGYGMSLARPAWAAAQVFGLPSLRLVGYVEAGWDNHQDVLSVARDGDRLAVRT